MKTSLKFLTVFSAIAVPSTFAAELAGVSLPSSFDSGAAFMAFVITFVTATAFSDYARPKRSSVLLPVPAKAAHPLAA